MSGVMAPPMMYPPHLAHGINSPENSWDYPNAIRPPDDPFHPASELGFGNEPSWTLTSAGTPCGHVVSVTNEEEWDEPRTNKGKGIAKSTKTRDSAFKLLDSKNEGPQKSTKLRLRPDMGKIGSFERLAKIFQKKYQDNCVKRKKFTYLNTVGQKEKETLIQFLTRWKEEMDKVEEIDENTSMSLLIKAFRSGELYTEFCRKPPAVYQEAYNTTWEYGEAENLNQSKRELEEGYKAKSSQAKREDQSGGSKSKTHHEGIVHEIRDDKKGGKPKKPWTDKWCTYHQSDPHNTMECWSMKVLLWEMVNKGEFSGEYAEEARKANRWNRPGEGEKDKAMKPPPRTEYITMIVGGPEGGDTTFQRKNWARSLNVETVSAEPHTKNVKREPITFSDRDLPRTGEDHNDPLVITMDINGADMARVLVDTGSSVNVLYLETFKKLKLDRS
ncbi:unnamed protein product [Cuscuta campestris]|uniref:Retrotransposon gag domain-containing protein n=1 Tax=Cuscuta campestris TaxID=132261 RepID=A0A484LUE8_9ASTE|nr:unnamed protein product [Cuscuta campestris]